MSDNNVYQQVPTAPPLEYAYDDNNVVTNEVVSNDADVKSVFDDPAFLKSLVGKMDNDTKELYEKELARKTQERLFKAEQEMLNKEITRQNWITQHNNEQALLGTILYYVWLTYLAVVCGIILVHLFGYSISHHFELLMNEKLMYFVERISSGTFLDMVGGTSLLLAFPFVILSVFIMIFFTDF